MTTVPLVSRLLFYSVAAAAIAGFAMAPKAHAAAFYLQDQSVRGLGRAYSGEVADVGVESLWYNPASIAESANEIYIGDNAIFTHSKVQDQGSTLTNALGSGPVGGQRQANDPVLFGVVPNMGGSYRLNDRFALGISTSAPFDFTSQYSGTSFERYESLKSRLTTLDLQTTLAAKVTDWLDLGVGFNTEYTSSNLAQAYPNIVPGAADGNSDLKGDGYNFGYSLGAQAHFQRLQLGLSYRSAIDHDLDGRVELSGLSGPLALANARETGSAHFTTPWILSLGGRYHLTDRLTLDAQVQRFGWSDFSRITVNAGPLSTVIPQGYRDTTSGAVGADYALTPAVTVRAGVGYDQSPTSITYRTTQVPDSDRMLYTLGGSWKVRSNLTLDAAAGYVAFRGSNVDNTQTFYAGTPLVTTLDQRASVSGDAKIASLGLRYGF